MKRLTKLKQTKKHRRFFFFTNKRNKTFFCSPKNYWCIAPKDSYLVVFQLYS